MELRLLQSFLAIAEERNITKAAELLHVTQPALSRQLSQLETELSTPLFIREKREMVLTDAGVLLRRRAEEILQLVDVTEEELRTTGETAGNISFGVGELRSCSIVLDAIAHFSQLNPKVTFSFLTGVADQVTERLDRGLLDFGLLLEPVDKHKYSFVRLHQKERWVAVVGKDDPLAHHETISPADLTDRTLILPSRSNVRNELASWFGRAYKKLDIRYIVNLGGIRAGLVSRGLGVLLSVEGSTSYWDATKYVSIPLSPGIESGTVLAWKRDVPRDSATTEFIRYVEQNF